ncbi:alpha/beta fold hydrolase [Methylobacterium brachythecii]|nr:alpha/beta hydrolase [Methylobacterium brachythecii]MBB3905571.1 pimeloyl-ACP methyl ester carboxylesterase [Methylobacterium brachythecii]
MNIVLIPGFMADDSLWDDMLPAMEAVGRITFGDTTRGSTISETAEHVVADAPARFVLVGFSMGGYIAREIARIAPERVEALVLVATSARADTHQQTRRKEVALKMMETRPFAGFSRPGILISLHPDRASDDTLIERVRAMSERVGIEVYRRQTSQFRESDLYRLEPIKCPTLIVAADRDALRSLEESEELHTGIAGSTMVVIERSGHMIPMERPDALAAAIFAWLREHVGK